MSIDNINATEHRIRTPQGELFVRDYAGDGAPFVLMHGFPDNHRIYDQLAPLLAKGGRRTIVFDFLGFGESDRVPGGPFSFAQQVGDLKAVADELGLERIIPVGHDASGPAALNFALDNPGRVESVCLLNCLYAAGPSTRVPELVALFATPSLTALAMAIFQSPEQFAWLLAFQQKVFRDALPAEIRDNFTAATVPIINDNFSGERSAAEAFAHLAAGLMEEVGKNTARLSRLATLKVPVSLIWGEYDPYLSTGVATDLMEHLPDATLHLVPGGHWVQLDRPEEVAKHMLG